MKTRNLTSEFYEEIKDKICFFTTNLRGEFLKINCLTLDEFIVILLALCRCADAILAGVAQSAEQLICNQQVDGSIPFTSSIFWGGSRVAKGGRL